MKFSQEILLGVLCHLVVCCSVGVTHGEDVIRLSPEVVTLLQAHCFDCHGKADEASGGFSIDQLVLQSLDSHRSSGERILRKLRSRQMPPQDVSKPSESEYHLLIDALENGLDQLSRQRPRPGQTETLRRLTRFEYQNAIRDLLDLEISADTWLPADEVSHGFDNITVGELSPNLLSRYVTAAQYIARQSLGRTLRSPDGKTIRLRPDLTQEEHVDGLPLGTRGGVLFKHHFPQTGEYEITVRLTRDRDEHVEGFSNMVEPMKNPSSHELEMLLDGERVGLFTVSPPKKRKGAEGNSSWEQESHTNIDQHLRKRLRVEAGSHEVGVTFIKKPSPLLETNRQPLNVHFNMYRHPRLSPAVFQVSITGPYQVEGNAHGLIARPPVDGLGDRLTAQRILEPLLNRACRGQADPSDLAGTMKIYDEARQEGSMEDALEAALSFILIHPKFLFRIERENGGATAPYPIDDLELASRLSFFLWSSIPDNELLDLASRKKLSEPNTLREQVLRMLGDQRSKSLSTHFVGQWLYLRNLEGITPDQRLYPDFDENLRQSMRLETELLFADVVRRDVNVLQLLRADYTFLNERLAKHYGIPNVYGSRFRRVDLPPQTPRGGILRHGSILTVTSYATRTSPVLRGKWILENLLGTPPPPPPPDVPALDETPISAKLPLRERLARHRADPVCAHCHNLIDPMGFALENYDAVGRWRDLDGESPIDSKGGLPDGRSFTDVRGLEAGLLDRPELFVGTLTEKLLVYALGRGLVDDDGPAVREILRQGKKDDYRFSSLVLGIVTSPPFQMRELR